MGDSVSPNEAPRADAALVASLLHFGKTAIRGIKQQAHRRKFMRVDLTLERSHTEDTE